MKIQWTDKIPKITEYEEFQESKHIHTILKQFSDPMIQSICKKLLKAEEILSKIKGRVPELHSDIEAWLR